MGAKRHPFQVAFRVLLTAFVLTVLVMATSFRPGRVMDGPASVPPTVQLTTDVDAARTARVDKTIESHVTTQQTLERTAEQSLTEHWSPAEPESEPTPAVAFFDEPQNKTAAASETVATFPDFDFEPTTTQATTTQTTVTSVMEVDSQSAATSVDRRASTFHFEASDSPRQTAQFSRATLQEETHQKEFVELPPPPNWDRERTLASNSPVASPVDKFPVTPEPPVAPPVETSPAALARDASSQGDQRGLDISGLLAQARVESEIVRLRREIERLSETKRISHQLERVESAQEELLRMHQQLPVDQVVELLHVVLAELQSVREMIPPPTPSAPPVPAAAQPEPASTGPRLEAAVSPDDRGRISINIVEARLDDVLLMLSTLSGSRVAVVSDIAAPNVAAPAASNSENHPPQIPALIAPLAHSVPEPDLDFPLPIPASPAPPRLFVEPPVALETSSSRVKATTSHVESLTSHVESSTTRMEVASAPAESPFHRFEASSHHARSSTHRAE
ncbi:MAG: hypothetical protein KF861_23605, partial [Planctomycetaceae bacterium]|nr:hypothetical protein [Planctomycetaceae bacterium]